MWSTTLGRVLIAEDEIRLMDALVEALTAEGYTATGFLTGEAALQALHAQEFDLLLTDLMMQGMDGITLLRTALAIDQNLVGIVMTGQGTVPTALEAMKTGAFDYVLKPFQLEAILPVLARAMEVRRLRLENIQLHETLAIYNLSQTLAFSLDSRKALAMTADAAIQQTDADEVSIMLLTLGNDELYIAAQRGGDREHLLGQRSSLQEGIAGWVARQAEPLILNGEVSDSRFAPIQPRSEIHSAISLPMLAAGKPVGVLNVNRLQPRRPFTLGQVRALSILTSTAAAALQNEALYSALEASEKRFRALIENSSDAVTLLNPEGLFLYTSASARRVLGYAPQELAGQNAFDLIHPDERETMLAGFMEVVQKPGEVATAQLRVRHKDGSWRWIEATAQNLLNEPSVQAIVVNNRDISERKQAEAAVLESERQMRALVTSLDDIVFEFDEQGTYLNVWAADESLLAQPKVQLLGKRIIEVLGEQNGRPFAEAVKRVIASGQPESIEYPLEVTGGQRWFVAWINPVLDADSAYRTASMLISDITARKQAEEGLREKERLLSEAQRIGHIGSWSYDIVADTLLYSDEMYRLLDVSPEEFQHNSEGFLSVIYSSDRPMVTKWMEGIRAGRQMEGLEFLVFRKNSELRYIYCRGAVKVDKAGKPARFIATAQDVTERKLAEIQIRQQIERLTALRKIDQAISSSFDLNVTLDILISQVISHLQVDAADVLLLEPDGQTLTFATGKGFRTQAMEPAHLHMADSQAGRAARERRLIHVETLKHKPDERLLTQPGASEGFVCYFGLPLIVKGKVKGVLEIFHRGSLQPYPDWLDFLSTLAGQAAIAIEDAQLFENLARSNRELSQAYDATIEGWSRALDLRDKETEGHTLRVTEITLKLALAFGLPEEDLLHIRRGALLHDIGKMGVPDSILLKPGALTDEESVRMRSHPQYAFELLKPITFLGPAIDIPYCHHEKWDGTGYPRGLKGEEIPLAARLFAVVDVWDALSSDRPYRPAWIRGKTLEYIKSLSGTHFDPKAVESFLELIQE